MTKNRYISREERELKDIFEMRANSSDPHTAEWGKRVLANWDKTWPEHQAQLDEWQKRRIVDNNRMSRSDWEWHLTRAGIDWDDTERVNEHRDWLKRTGQSYYEPKPENMTWGQVVETVVLFFCGGFLFFVAAMFIAWCLGQIF